MDDVNTLEWLRHKPQRIQAMIALDQPLTLTQLNQRLGCMPHQIESTRSLLQSLRAYKRRNGLLVVCLNPKATRQRLYVLTNAGRSCRDMLREQYGLPISSQEGDWDWPLYAECCHRYRSSALRVMAPGIPIQPATLKRLILRQLPDIKISANNLRDVMKWMVSQGLLQIVEVRGRAHKHFELTDLGVRFQKLLQNAYTPIHLPAEL